MKDLCLLYDDTHIFAKLTPAEVEAVGPSRQPHDDALRATGKVNVHASLALPVPWKAIRPMGGKPVMSGGRDVDASEQASANDPRKK